MNYQQLQWKPNQGWKTLLKRGESRGETFSLVLYFGDAGLLEDPKRFEELQSQFPKAQIIGCSTGGEILNDDSVEGSIVAAALGFEKTKIKVDSVICDSPNNWYQSGIELAHKMIGNTSGNPDEALRMAMVYCDGFLGNGSDLVRGLKETLGARIPIVGGLAMDTRMKQCLVGANAPPRPNLIAAAGFYGDAFEFKSATFHGCSPYGPIRTVTKSIGQTIYELDGQGALGLLRKYLLEDGESDPENLRFTMRVKPNGLAGHEYNRAVIAIDEKNGGIKFAGDVPQGSRIQLLRTTLHGLVEAAEEAGSKVLEEIHNPEDYFAVLISCVGRKLIHGDRIVAEVEAASDALGKKMAKIGFYSHGEICPHMNSGISELHNHTMTMFLLNEH